MKKWYDEEYEFTVEVTGFCMEIIRKGIAVMAKKSAMYINAPTDVRLIRTVMGSVQRQ